MLVNDLKTCRTELLSHLNGILSTPLELCGKYTKNHVIQDVFASRSFPFFSDFYFLSIFFLDFFFLRFFFRVKTRFSALCFLSSHNLVSQTVL